MLAVTWVLETKPSERAHKHQGNSPGLNSLSIIILFINQLILITFLFFLPLSKVLPYPPYLLHNQLHVLFLIHTQKNENNKNKNNNTKS